MASVLNDDTQNKLFPVFSVLKGN